MEKRDFINFKVQKIEESTFSSFSTNHPKTTEEQQQP